MLGEVVGAHEAPVADGTAELLLAGVRPLVARQLVRAREATLATLPDAHERLLACHTIGQPATIKHHTPSTIVSFSCSCSFSFVRD